MKNPLFWVFVFGICLGFFIWGLGFGLVGCGSSLPAIDSGSTTVTTVATTTTKANITTTTKKATTTTTVFGPTTTTIPYTGPTYSISGKVLFATTSDPVKGGVEVYNNAPFTPHLLATADAQTGEFTITGCPPGMYTLNGNKSNWTVDPKYMVQVTNSDVTGQNLTATPEKWQILHVGGGSLNTINSYQSGDPLVAGGGASSVLLKSSDPYTGWNSVSSLPTSQKLVTILGKAPFTIIDRTAWAYSSTDECNSWTLANLSAFGITNPITNEAISDLELLLGGKVYVTETGKLIKSTSNTSFSDVTPAGAFINGFLRDSIGAINITVVGNNGATYRTTNGGSTWTALGVFPASATLESLSQGYFGESGKGLIVSANGTIFQTFNGGATWEEALSGIPYPLYGINMPEIGTFVVGGNGLIMQQLFW